MVQIALTSKTLRLDLDLLEPAATGQVPKANNGSALFELLVGTINIEDKDLTAPPTLVNGNGYLIPASPTGAWAGKTGKLAFGINSAWSFVTPWDGLTVYVKDEKKEYRWSATGSVWVPKINLRTWAAKTADFTAALTEADRYEIDATAGNIVVTLPAVASSAGVEFCFKRTDASVNTVTLDGASSETIDGVTTQLMTSLQALRLSCNGTKWYLV
jgi:hypothetical protein